MHNIDVSLYERYELLDLNRDVGVKTFEAREIATGRPVKVHLFVHPAAPLQALLLKAIGRLPETERARILDQGKHEGTPYVVTDRLADYEGLSEWVQAAGHHNKPDASKAAKPPLETAGAWKVPPAPVPVVAPAPAPNSPSSLNQQFSELFATAQRPIVADSLPQNPAPAKPPAAPPAAKAEPGEFTRMFQSPVAAVSAPAPPPVAPPAKKEPGEFTRMFQSPATPASPSAAKSAGGDFTRAFETPSPAGPMPHIPAAQQSGRSGHNQVSEFTRTFGKGELELPPVAQPSAPPPQKEPGEFTRMFHAPGAAVPVAAAPAVRPAPPPMGNATQGFATPPPPPAVPKPSGPGDYTRQFSAPAQLTFGQTSATPSASPAASPSPQAYAPPAMAQPAMPNMQQGPVAPKKSNLVLILGIVGIVVVAALLIVFFAMRPK